MIAFVSALGLTEIDLLGFSIGGFVAQEMALIRPALVRRLILAATAPKGGPGMHGWRDGHREAARAGAVDRGEPAAHLLRTDRDQPCQGRRVPRPLPGT